MVRKLLLQHHLDNKVLDEESFNCMVRLADLVGAHWPYKNYNQYLAHEARVAIRREEIREAYYRKLNEQKVKE